MDEETEILLRDGEVTGGDRKPPAVSIASAIVKCPAIYIKDELTE